MNAPQLPWHGAIRRCNQPPSCSPPANAGAPSNCISEGPQAPGCASEALSKGRLGRGALWHWGLADAQWAGKKNAYLPQVSTSHVMWMYPARFSKGGETCQRRKGACWKPVTKPVARAGALAPWLGLSCSAPSLCLISYLNSR